MEWVVLAETWLRLFYNKDKLMAELLDELKEVENDFSYGLAYWFEDETPHAYVPTVEEEVFRREANREVIRLEIKRLQTKTDLVSLILNQLTDDERQVLMNYKDKGLTFNQTYMHTLERFYTLVDDSETYRKNYTKTLRRYNRMVELGLGKSGKANKLKELLDSMGVVKEVI